LTDTLLNHRAEGPASAPPLLLGPSLGTSYALWDKVAPELSLTHRVIRWDLPGHGGSAADLIGPGAGVGDLADLVLALADSLGVERFAYAGVSLGGDLVPQRVRGAQRRPEQQRGSGSGAFGKVVQSQRRSRARSVRGAAAPG
jgi:alpha-beta hydrolase superfamily lysophospholipase